MAVTGRGRWMRVLVGVVVAVVAGLLGVLGLTRARADRAWAPEQGAMARVAFDGSRAQVDSVRAFRYTGSGVYEPGYATETFDLDSVVSVDFVLTPFAQGWRGPAHSFVTFGFADGRHLAISVEARRERGETYGPVAGLFRRYELMYVVGTEADLIGQRAAFAGYPVYLYPIRTERAKMQGVLRAMLERAEGLRTTPEFYNTLTSNCTSNIVDHVNAVAERPVPGGYKTILPGYIDEVAHQLGLIDTDLGIEAARERFRVDPEIARAALGASDFSARIRAGRPALPAVATAAEPSVP